MANTEIRLILFFAAIDGEVLYSQQKQAGQLSADSWHSAHLTADARATSTQLSESEDLGLVLTASVDLHNLPAERAF